MSEIVRKVRNRVADWLIRFANFVAVRDYYELGSSVKGLASHKNDLFAFTSEAVYIYKNGKLVKVKGTK